MNHAGNIGAPPTLFEERGDRVRQASRPLEPSEDSAVIVKALDRHGLGSASGPFRLDTGTISAPGFVNHRNPGWAPRRYPDKGADIHAHSGQSAKGYVRVGIDSRGTKGNTCRDSHS